MISFLSDKEIYGKVICGIVPRTRNRLWIATADIKDMYVAMPGHAEMVPFLQVLDSLLGRGVAIRLIHAKEPGPNSARTSTVFRGCGRRWRGCSAPASISSASSPIALEPISAAPI